MPVVYDGKPIIPAPFVRIDEDFVRGEDGRLRRKGFVVTVKGKLSVRMGSPRADGTFWEGGNATPPPPESVPVESCLAVLRNKQGALSRLFDRGGVAGGGLFEIQPGDATAPTKFVPRVTALSFDEGKWTDVCDYTVRMETDRIWFGEFEVGGLVGVEAEESWSFEADASQDGRSYRVSHTVSSQQRAVFDEEGNIVKAGWEAARDIVVPRLGFGPTPDLIPVAVPALQNGWLASNYSRSQSIDQSAGRFSVTENWTMTWGQRWVEEFTVTRREQDGRVRVSLEGTVTGLVTPDLTIDPYEFAARKYAAAREAWETGVSPNLLERAQTAAGKFLNPVFLSSSLGHSPIKGTIVYSREYDDRAASLVPGSLSETFTVQQQNPSDVAARLVVPGRLAGPIYQPIGTVTGRTRTVSAEIVMPPAVWGSPTPQAPEIDAAVLSFRPAGTNVLLDKDDVSWTPNTGRYSRQTTWSW